MYSLKIFVYIMKEHTRGKIFCKVKESDYALYFLSFFEVMLVFSKEYFLAKV